MMDPITEAGTVEIRVGEAVFIAEKRSTLLLARAVGAMKVFGLVRGAGETRDIKDGVTPEEYADLVRGVVTAALIDPVVVGDDEEALPPKSYRWRNIEPFADKIFDAVMESSVDVDPTPPPSEAGAGRISQ